MQHIKAKLNTKIQLPKESSQSITKEKRNECDLIFDQIYISGYKSSLDYEFLKSIGVTHIVNCAGKSSRFQMTHYEDFKYLVLELRDDPSTNIRDYVYELLKFIQKAEEENKSRKILIHCYEGISRAPALLSAYLMYKHKCDVPYAINFIKEKRSCIDINLGFIYQLEKLKEEFEKNDSHTGRLNYN